MLEFWDRKWKGHAAVTLLEGKDALSDAGCHVQRQASSLMCTPERYKTASIIRSVTIPLSVIYQVLPTPTISSYS